MTQRGRSALLLLTASATAGALLAAGGSPAEALADVRRPVGADPFAPLIAAAALLGQLLAGHLAVVSALSLAADLPGLLGAAARTCAARLSPPLVRRILGVALGVTTAVATVGVGTASATGPTSPRTGAAVPALDWPTGAPTPAPSRVAAPASLDWPGVPAPAVEPAPAMTAAMTAPAPRPVRPAPAATVAPGDTLWAIAARHLPADAADAAIARAWPTWWSANRDAIGADPDLITPGTQLAPPAPPAR